MTPLHTFNSFKKFQSLNPLLLPPPRRGGGPEIDKDQLADILVA
jgi:hypothetical protein